MNNLNCYLTNYKGRVMITSSVVSLLQLHLNEQYIGLSVCSNETGKTQKLENHTQHI